MKIKKIKLLTSTYHLFYLLITTTLKIIEIKNNDVVTTKAVKHKGQEYRNIHNEE